MADDRHGRAQRRGGVRHRLAGVSRRARVLPALLEQARFPFSGLLATHGDWDHLLGRLAFAGGALGVAESTALRLREKPGAAQRALRDFDERHYLTRPAPLALGTVEALPVPGYCGLGDAELELHRADGHTVDGMAVWIPWAAVLVCGDYLSPVEIPTPGASMDGYLATLARLEPLVARLLTSSRVTAAHSSGVLLERCYARTATTSRDCATDAGTPRRCRRAAATASSADCTPRTWRGSPNTCERLW